MRRLTKEDILQGANRRESIYIKDYDAEVVIKPLTDGELSKIFSIMDPLPLTKDGTPDLSKIEIHKNFEVLRLAVSMGLVEPKLTVDDISNMKFGIPEQIGMKILELSGVMPADIVKKKLEK
jgi:hypothetical protein